MVLKGCSTVCSENQPVDSSTSAPRSKYKTICQNIHQAGVQRLQVRCNGHTPLGKTLWLNPTPSLGQLHQCSLRVSSMVLCQPCRIMPGMALTARKTDYVHPGDPALCLYNELIPSSHRLSRSQLNILGRGETKNPAQIREPVGSIEHGNKHVMQDSNQDIQHVCD